MLFFCLRVFKYLHARVTTLHINIQSTSGSVPTGDSHSADVSHHRLVLLVLELRSGINCVPQRYGQALMAGICDLI